MLLNLTNHPSKQWSAKQYDHAIELYKEVIDLPFPQISPALDSASLDILVDEYEIKIRQLNPLAVHLMGEMTFAFRLVQRLKFIGISCIASTTERITEQVGDTKTSRFEFVQFRAY
ncbi:CRISPR-associated protein [Cellulophaga sp. BC115SP]|uniref:CRISPR-associated protein n=1 Tax=Cellulophaga sp. BC115SP TaxID=2683263 RepID=UPI00141248F6|nr:CRISPR-associated protein [Cellulophaga sp. BC115SP]NBB31241.1 CRISPR-associated protein [Cellulophaga sp. BC115SP]